MNKLVKNTSIYALGDIIPKLLAFISFPILTSYLLPAEYAIVNYVNTVNIFLLIISLLGLNTYYLVYYFRVGDEIAQKKLLGNLSIFIIGMNMIFTTIFFLLGPKITNLTDSNISFYPYLAIGIATNFFNILTILPSALYRVQEKPLPLTILNVIKGILIFSLTIILVVFFQFKTLGVLYSNLFVSIVFGVIFLRITLKNMVWKIDWKQIKAALLFAIPLVPGSISYYLVSLSDRVLIDKYLTLTELGIYSTAASLALVLNIITQGAYKAFEPHFFKIYGTTSFVDQFTKIRNYYFFCIMCGATAIALFSKEFFTIFSNPKFHAASFYTPIILISIVFSSITILYATIITARNKTKINSAIIIVGGIISVTINILLLPRIGVLASCFSSIITFGIILIASIYFSKIRISHTKTIISFGMCIFVLYICLYLVDVKNLFISISYKLIVLIVLCTIISLYLDLELISRLKLFIKKKRSK